MNRLQSVEADIRRSATKVVQHQDQTGAAIWRRLFDAPKEPHLFDQARDFAVSLDGLLEVPHRELSGADLSAVGCEVDRVIERLETRIDALADPREAMPFVAAIYALRKRFEEISMRARSGDARVAV